MVRQKIATKNAILFGHRGAEWRGRGGSGKARMRIFFTTKTRRHQGGILEEVGESSEKVWHLLNARVLFQHWGLTCHVIKDCNAVSFLTQRSQRRDDRNGGGRGEQSVGCRFYRSELVMLVVLVAPIHIAGFVAQLPMRRRCDNNIAQGTGPPTPWVGWCIKCVLTGRESVNSFIPGRCPGLCY